MNEKPEGELREVIERFGEKAVAEELSDPVILSRAAQISGKRGGRKEKLSPCPWCGEEYGSRRMKVHLTFCQKRPKP